MAWSISNPLRKIIRRMPGKAAGESQKDLRKSSGSPQEVLRKSSGSPQEVLR